MKLLVTGGAGYIGSHFVAAAVRQGHDVVVVDNLYTGHRKAVSPDVKFVCRDLWDADLALQVVEETKPTAIVHFAGAALVPQSARHPSWYYANNVVVTLNLLDAATDFKVKGFVFSSSCAVYGDQAVNLHEQSPTTPINPYGRTKLAAEMAIRDYSAVYNFGHYNFRYFNAVGASDDGRLGEDHSPETHLIPTALEVALGQRASLKIHGDGSQVRDYVHVEDLVDAHLRALEPAVAGDRRTLNLGTGSGWTVNQVVEVCREVTGHSIPVEYVAARDGDPYRLVAWPEKAAEVLGWSAQRRSLRESVASAWRWMNNNPNGYGGRW